MDEYRESLEKLQTLRSILSCHFSVSINPCIDNLFLPGSVWVVFLELFNKFLATKGEKKINVVLRTSKQLRCPSPDKWIKKMWDIYVYIVIKEKSFVGKWMDCKTIMLSEINRQSRVCILWFLFYGNPKT